MDKKQVTRKVNKDGFISYKGRMFKTILDPKSPVAVSLPCRTLVAIQDDTCYYSNVKWSMGMLHVKVVE